MYGLVFSRPFTNNNIVFILIDKHAKKSNTVSKKDTIMFQNALLNEIIAFIAVAEEGSFTRAAENLRSTKSSTGKAIQKLEKHLNVKLFNRSTRSVKLTEEGQIFFDVAKKAIDSINETKQILDARKVEAVGTLRVNMPIGIGRVAVKELAKFINRYPKVKVEISLSDKFEEAIEGKWDIVVRIGKLEDTGMVAKQLCTLKRILVASPDYLDRRGAPEDLKDLRSHDAVMFLSPNGQVRQWRFANKKQGFVEKIMEPTALFHDGNSFISAVVNGIGIGQVYDKVVQDLLDDNSLVEIFPEYGIVESPVNAIVPSGRLMPKKTRVFVNFLQEIFSEKSL